MDSSNASADALVDLIFSKCTLVYGRDFLGRWEGLDMAEVKADWRRELHGWLIANPQAIRHALENLPAGKPPDVLQFRELCRRRPEAAPLALEAPRANPERVRREIARLRDLRRDVGPKHWAHRLRERDQAGERLCVVQRVMYREALKTDDQTATGGQFRGIAEQAVPPGMAVAAVGPHATLDAARAGLAVKARDIDRALVDTGDMPQLSDAEAPWLHDVPTFDEEGATA
jgi:hypothetical protein